MTPRPHRTHRLTLVELCRWGVTLAALVVAVTAAFVDVVGLAPVAMVLALVGVASSLHVLLHPDAPGEPVPEAPPEAPPAPRALVPVAGES